MHDEREFAISIIPFINGTIKELHSSIPEKLKFPKKEPVFLKSLKNLFSISCSNSFSINGNQYGERNTLKASQKLSFFLWYSSQEEVLLV